MPKHNINFSKSTRYRNRKGTSVLLDTTSSEDENKVQPFDNSYISLAFNLENIDKSISDNLSLVDSFEMSDKASESISTSSVSSDLNETPDLKLAMTIWAITHNITHVALTDFLKCLSEFPEFKDIPKDSRTLLKTLFKTIVKNIGGGCYSHFGVKEEIKDLFVVHKNIPPVLWLHVGIDGLPITNNLPSQLWPILGYFANILTKKNKCFHNWCISWKNKTC